MQFFCGEIYFMKQEAKADHIALQKKSPNEQSTVMNLYTCNCRREIVLLFPVHFTLLDDSVLQKSEVSLGYTLQNLFLLLLS